MIATTDFGSTLSSAAVYVEFPPAGYATVDLSATATGGWQDRFYIDGREIWLSPPLGPLQPMESNYQTGLLLNLGRPDVFRHKLEIVVDSGWSVEPEVNELYYVKPGPGYSNTRAIYITFCDFVPIVSASHVMLAGRPLPSLQIKGVACLADDLMEDVSEDDFVHRGTRRSVTLTYNETNWGNNSADGGFFSGRTGWTNEIRYDGNVLATNFDRPPLAPGETRSVTPTQGSPALQLPSITQDTHLLSVAVDVNDDIAYLDLSVSELEIPVAFCTATLRYQTGGECGCAADLEAVRGPNPGLP